MLEDAELALCQWQLQTRLEIVVRVQSLFFVLLFVWHCICFKRWDIVKVALNVRSMEGWKRTVIPIQFEVREVLDTERMTKLVRSRVELSSMTALFVLVRTSVIWIGVRIRTARIIVRLVLITVTGMMVRLWFFMLDVDYWLICRCLRSVLLLLASALFLTLEPENSLLNFDSLAVEVLVQVFFKVDWGSPVSFCAL